MHEGVVRRGLGGAEPPPASELVLTHIDRLAEPVPIAIRLFSTHEAACPPLDDLCAIAAADGALTGRALALANSPAFGPGGEIGDLACAGQRLGLTGLGGVLLAAELMGRFGAQDGPSGTSLDRLEFWTHTLAVALAARRLAADRQELGIVPDTAFAAGLLHDIGKLALAAVFPKAYRRVLAEAQALRADIAECERSLLGTDHFVAGRRLAERWNLPGPYQEAIWLHGLSPGFLPVGLEQPGLVILIHVCDVLARQTLGSRVEHFGRRPRLDELASALGVPGAALDAIAARLADETALVVAALKLGGRNGAVAAALRPGEGVAELNPLRLELASARRQLETARRYLDALAALGARLERSGGELSQVVAGCAEALARCLPARRVLVFAVNDPPATLDVAMAAGGSGPLRQQTLQTPPRLLERLDAAAQEGSARFEAAPAELSEVLDPGWPVSGGLWWRVLRCGRTPSGGILLAGERDPQVELTEQSAELTVMCGQIALLLQHCRALHAARRLADDLAETNRRIQFVHAEQLRARALAMIAEMAAGAGHELNTPLAVISGRAQMLSRGAADPQVRAALELIEAKAHECSRIVSELMDFARPRPPAMAEFDVREFLEAALAEWRRASRLPASRLTLTLEPTHEDGSPAPAAGPVRIRGDRGQIQAALFELLANAQEATAANDGGIHVSWAPWNPIGAGPAAGFAEPTRPLTVAGRGWVEIRVCDCGCGMTPSVAERAFDPFFSHRRAGRGRGLGLTRVYRTVEAHGGRVWFESRPDEGTTVHVLLPAAEVVAVRSA